jgi:hypothetical protein
MIPRALLSAMVLLAGCGGDQDDAGETTVATVSGNVWIFGPPGGPLAEAEIYVLEHPDIRTTSDQDGRFELADVPAGDVTLVMVGTPSFPENQLGTHTLGSADLDDVDFQAVSGGVYNIFASLAGADPDPALCQVSSTVTRWFEGELPTVHGEPGATATIDPALPDGRSVIYFNPDVLPTPGLTETSVDGGVVWTNVSPGEYVLRADKDDVEFKEVRIKCRAGVLVNAAPPRGLQATVPGSGY